MEQIIYTNTEAIAIDLDSLEVAKVELNKASEFVRSNGATPTKENVLALVEKNDVSAIVKEYQDKETIKVKRIIEQFGDTAITDGWELKVGEKTKTFADSLKNQVGRVPFYIKDYIKYFELDKGVFVVSVKFDEDYFTKKNSLILSSKADVEKLQKHQQLCELLNEMIGRPENEFEAMDELFYFNAESRQFEISAAVYFKDSDYVDLAKKRADDLESERENEKARIYYAGLAGKS